MEHGEKMLHGICRLQIVWINSISAAIKKSIRKDFMWHHPFWCWNFQPTRENCQEPPVACGGDEDTITRSRKRKKGTWCLYIYINPCYHSSLAWTQMHPCCSSYTHTKYAAKSLLSLSLNVLAVNYLLKLPYFFSCWSSFWLWSVCSSNFSLLVGLLLVAMVTVSTFMSMMWSSISL